MTFNFEKGKIVARVKGGVLDGQYLRVTPTDYEPRRSFSYIALPDGEFIPTPCQERERDSYYIVGSSGSGKSYFTRQYAQEYNRVYPDRPVYLFSKIRDDDSLKGIDNLKSVKVQKFTSPVTAASFYQNTAHNSLLVFDDVDTISKPEIRLSLKQLKDDALELGRHQNLSFISIAHLGTRGAETRRDLSEAQVLVVFPMSLNGSNMRMLEAYAGLTKKDIMALKKRVASRWVMIHLHMYPQVWVSQREAGLLSELAGYQPHPLRQLADKTRKTAAEIENEKPQVETCPCGGKITYQNRNRHLKTKKHRLWDAKRHDEYYAALLEHPKDEMFDEGEIEGF